MTTRSVTATDLHVGDLLLFHDGRNVREVRVAAKELTGGFVQNTLTPVFRLTLTGLPEQFRGTGVHVAGDLVVQVER